MDFALSLQLLEDDVRHMMRRLLAVDDRRVLAKLLPLVHQLLGEAAWTAADLSAAAMVGRGHVADDLVALVGEYTSERGGLRQFGNLLERCEGCVIGGIRLVRIGTDGRAGAVYQLKVLATFDALETRAAGGGA
ncbi:hypothetical protein [uncultured Piscinibacter sp.]|uniref:hypothetical protein n=1 Tax=uncultured Piscinibacter sp. TaxID=1131835 RepID=UPI002637589B|nr:hypothetical protein [uncultured Piscinibacter sp.]